MNKANKICCIDLVSSIQSIISNIQNKVTFDKAEKEDIQGALMAINRISQATIDKLKEE